MSIRTLGEEERERSGFDLLTDHVVIFRDGCDALVLDEDGILCNIVFWQRNLILVSFSIVQYIELQTVGCRLVD